MKYVMDINTPSYVCDVHDRLHTWASVRLCQEVTELHGNATGIGFKELIKQNRAWVLTRAFYNVLKRPSAFDDIELSTWSRGNDGLFAFRDYRMKNADGKVIMNGTTYWVLMDFMSRRVTRLNSALNNYPFDADVATELISLDKLPDFKYSEQDLTMTIPVNYSMLDHTNHVNNSEYIKWIFDALHQLEFDQDKPFSINLNYQHETKYGDAIKIYAIHTDDSYHLKLVNSVGTSVAAEIKYI